MSAAQLQQTQSRKLQNLRDRLTIRQDDIVHTKALLQKEGVELGARREQRDKVQERIASVLKEMDDEAAAREEAKAARLAVLAEEEYLRDSLAAILQTEVEELRLGLQKKAEEAQQQSLEIDDGTVREVSVHFETEEVVFRVNDTYTFESLKSDACRYFEVHPLEYFLTNEHEEEWVPDSSVRESLAQFDNQYGRVHLRPLQQNEEEDLDYDPEDLLALLAGEEEPTEQEVAEDEAVEAATAGKVAATMGDEPEEPKKKKKLNKRQLYMELPQFLFFFLMFVTSLSTRRTVKDHFYQINAIRTALFEENFGDYNEKAFSDIANFAEMFDWLEGVFAPGLFPDETYDGETVTSADLGNVMQYNKLVGAIRFRQVRTVPNIGCNLAKMNRRTMVWPNGTTFEEDFVDTCYVNLAASVGNEQKSTFGPAVGLVDEDGKCDHLAEPLGPHGIYNPESEHADRTLCEAFTYKSEAETQERPFVSPLGILYPGGGYVRDVYNPINCEPVEPSIGPGMDPLTWEQVEAGEEIPGVEPLGMCKRVSFKKCVEEPYPQDGEKCNDGMGKTETRSQVREDLMQAINQIKDNRWLDANTRAIFIKVAFYNGNTKVFVTAIFLIEFTLGGTCIPTATFGSVATEGYEASLNSGDPVAMFAVISEFILYANYAYLLFRAVRNFVKSVRKEGSLGAYFGDIWNLVELVVLIVLIVSVSIRISLLTLLPPPEVIFLPSFIDFSYLAQQYALSFNIDGLCVIILFFQMFKYLQLSQQANMLWSVLAVSAKDIMYFLLMFVILMLGFGLMGEQMLGTNLEGYKTIFECIISLFIVLMGAFDVEEFKIASPAFGIPYFLLFILLMFLILMNIFLAILGEAYSFVREQMDQTSEQQVQTKKRSLKEYVKLICTVLKKKQAARRSAKEAKRAEALAKAEKRTSGMAARMA